MTDCMVHVPKIVIQELASTSMVTRDKVLTSMDAIMTGQIFLAIIILFTVLKRTVVLNLFPFVFTSVMLRTIEWSDKNPATGFSIVGVLPETGPAVVLFSTYTVGVEPVPGLSRFLV